MSRLACLFCCLMLTPLMAFGHVDAPATGLSSGLLHPLGGLDHLLALWALGLWAARLGGAARWQLPLVFTTALVLGHLLAVAGLALPWSEQGIGLSVVVLGLLLAFAVRRAAPVWLGLAAVFALCHGLAHGAEMPPTVSGSGYLLGLVLTSLALQLAALTIGALAGARRFSRLNGALVALAGAALAIA